MPINSAWTAINGAINDVEVFSLLKQNMEIMKRLRTNKLKKKGIEDFK